MRETEGERESAALRRRRAARRRRRRRAQRQQHYLERALGDAGGAVAALVGGELQLVLLLQCLQWWGEKNELVRPSS